MSVSDNKVICKLYFLIVDYLLIKIITNATITCKSHWVLASIDIRNGIKILGNHLNTVVMRKSLKAQLPPAKGSENLS